MLLIPWHGNSGVELVKDYSDADGVCFIGTADEFTKDLQRDRGNSPALLVKSLPMERTAMTPAAWFDSARAPTHLLERVTRGLAGFHRCAGRAH